jgi:hypothetical protein
MVTQREFAKLRGVTPKSVQIWKQRGLIVFATSGGVDVAASEKLIDARPDVIRGGRTKPRPTTPTSDSGATGAALSDDAVFADPALADIPASVLDDAATWSRSEATRKKEIALALLRQLEFDRESALVVPIAEVVKQVAVEYGLVRDRVLAIPGKIADELANLDRAGIEKRLRAECYEALSELHEPSYGQS